MLWDSSCTQVGKHLGRDFSDTGCIAELPEKWSIAFLRKCVQRISKNSTRNHTNPRKLQSGSILRGPVVFSEACRAGLAAEAQKCKPEVAKFAESGGNLKVKLTPKSIVIMQFSIVFEDLLQAKAAPTSGQNRIADAFRRSERVESVT